MRLINRVLLLSALALAAPTAAFARSANGAAPAADEIRRLEGEYDGADARGDAEALGRLQTDDFRMTARGA